MKPGRTKDLLAIVALVAASGFGGWLFLRSHGGFGTSWTDGESQYSSETGAGIRHAVWAPAERLEGIEGDAADPTLSPDGRLLVFASGSRGLNSELYVAELEGGRAGEAVPLAALDTSADELAPAFGAGALYFASDRPGGQGGLDLWRAPYADGVFGPAEPLAAGLNSAADESDPAPLAGSELFFASNRERAMRTDFDLYRADMSADMGASTRYEVEPLEALNTPFDEREPALSADQRVLYFASDRAGPFALLRAVRQEESWGEPAPVPGLAASGAQRGPWVSADGFALLFEAEGEGGARELLRARSLEIFLVPPPAVTLAQWLLLGAFLVLALLALLAKRWEALDILLKCYLVSLIVHLLLLLYLRTVEQGGGSIEPRDGGEPTFRVQLEPESTAPRSAPTLEARASRSESAPERADISADVARAAAPEAAALAVPERTLEAAPLAQEAPVVPATSAGAASPELAQPEESSERYAASAVALALPAPDALPRAPSAAAEPARAGETQAEVAHAQPSASRNMKVNAAAAELERGTAPARVDPTPTAAPATALAAPSESTARDAAPAPELALAAATGPARAPKTDAHLERGSIAAEGLPQAAPEASSHDLVARSASSASTAPAPAPAAPSPAPALTATSGAPPLRAPGMEAPGAAPASAPTFDAAAGLTGTGAVRPTRAAVEPARQGVPEGAAAPVARSSAPETLPMSVPASGLAGFADAPRAPALSTAMGSAPAPVAANPSLRGPAEEKAPAPLAARAPAFELGSGAAASTGAAPRAEVEPEREALSGGAARMPRSAAPGALPLAVPATELAEAPRAPAPGTAMGHAPAPVETNPSLRGPVEEKAPAPLAARAPAFELGAGATAASAPRARDATAPAPERAPLAERAEAPRRSARPSELEASPVPLADTERIPSPRLPDTPYQNRFGQQKLRALEEFGGSEETEHAVAAGLDYLARIQEKNGAWGQASDAHDKYLDVRVGKTGLALLALLGAGHVPNGSSEHAAVAERAVRYLLGVQDQESGHFGRSCSYGHGIATYALAECFALTQDERLRAPLERAVAEILAHQAHGSDPERAGGWGYYFADDHVWNGDTWPRTSVTAWQVMALESASLGGLAVPEQTFEEARGFLLNTWDPRARAFRYDHDPERLSSGYPILPASTPAALFALALVGVDPTRDELREARRFVLTRAPDGYRNTGDADFVLRARGNLYFWYYATLAMFRVGGTEWERWNAALKETLLPAQDEDGSWRPIDTYSEYAGDEDGERTYTTAMCVLSLEIYYRYFTPLLRVR